MNQQPTELEIVLDEIHRKTMRDNLADQPSSLLIAVNIYGLDNLPLDFLRVYNEALGD